MATLNDYYNRVDRTLEDDIENYNISSFVETGTGLGDTVAYVLSNSKNLIDVLSVEIYKDIANKASERFQNYTNCKIINNNSYDGLLEILPSLKERVLFFLDAHFPGADFGYTSYGDDIEINLKLPLQRELELICSNRDTSRDVFLIDDLRIYEEGNYELGNWPKENGAVHTGIDFIYDYLAKTHNIQKHSFCSGFITILPKQ